jgi:hypothetical protein
MQNSIELDFVANATWWRSLLRHCATNQKVAGSIPDGVNWNFSLTYTPGLTMTLASTQPVTKMSTRGIPCVIKPAGAQG